MPDRKEQVKKSQDPNYHILVFGKAGCDKCAILEKRLDNILDKKEWADFTKTKFDLETEEGLIEFCSVECMNPQRVPAFVIARRDRQSGELELIPGKAPGKQADKQDPCADSRLYTWLGLQTDYSEKSGGVISSKMITTILNEARAY